VKTFVLSPNAARPKILAAALEYIKTLPDHRVWAVMIDAREKPRSNRQSRYLRGVAYPLIVAKLGHKPDDWHQFFCGEFFGWLRRELPGGRFENIPRRTTTTDEKGKRDVMSAAAFCDLVILVQATAAAAGVDIPDPCEQVPDRFDER
jgi:hypothetical protein